MGAQKRRNIHSVFFKGAVFKFKMQFAGVAFNIEIAILFKTISTSVTVC